MILFYQDRQQAVLAQASRMQQLDLRHGNVQNAAVSRAIERTLTGVTTTRLDMCTRVQVNHRMNHGRVVVGVVHQMTG